MEGPKRENHKGNIKFPIPPNRTFIYCISKSQNRDRLAHALTPLTLFAYKMCTKLEKEDFQCPSFLAPVV
jgi:hypothetical protein